MAVRYEHSGNAAPTTLATSITNASATINIAASTGWPTGATAPFWTTIDRGTASEERVLVLSRTGTTLTVSARGADGTTATSHAAGAVIEHTSSALEADDANALAAQVTSLGGTPVTTSAAQALTNKTFSGAGNVFGSAQTIPPGVILEYGGSAAPTGWLLCDGAAVSRATYASLYAALGGAASPHGQGDGSTTFNVPDHRGRVAVGAGTGAGLTARTLGTKAGTEDNAVVSHSHSHSHSGSSGTVSVDHTHGFSGNTGGFSQSHTHATAADAAAVLAGGGSLARRGGSDVGSTGGASADHTHFYSGSTGGISANHTHAITVGTDATVAGSSGVGANMMPHIVVQHIIKT